MVFILVLSKQTERHATSAQYNTMQKLSQSGLSKANELHSHTSQQSVPLSLLLVSRFLYAVAPRQLLEQDTGVCHLHLTNLLTAHLPALSPAADLAEPRPPRHIPPPPDSGRGAVRPADPPTHISGEEFSHSHLYTRSVDHLEFKRLQSQIPTSDPRVGILHAVEPLQRGVVQTESEFPSQEIISEGEAHLMPNTPSLWCCT